MLPKIEFEFDEPVALTLRYTQGLEAPSKYYERWPGDTIQYRFVAEEGIFWLPDTSGALLNARLKARGITPGEAVFITKTRVPNLNTSRLVVEYVPERCE